MKSRRDVRGDFDDGSDKGSELLTRRLIVLPPLGISTTRRGENLISQRNLFDSFIPVYCRRSRIYRSAEINRIFKVIGYPACLPRSKWRRGIARPRGGVREKSLDLAISARSKRLGSPAAETIKFPRGIKEETSSREPRTRRYFEAAPVVNVEQFETISRQAPRPTSRLKALR